MARDHADAPAFWIEQLVLADEDIAHGRVVPGHVVTHELQTALAELEAEIAADAAVTAYTNQRNR